MMCDYKLEFRSIDPARRYGDDDIVHADKFVIGFNRNGMQNIPSDKNVISLLKAWENVNNRQVKFIIKPYQRGFRWNATDNVEKLLDDLSEYSNGRQEFFNKTRLTYNKSITEEEFDFYCLQTLTVRQEEPGVWEVIDGQQRLTCVFLIYMILSSFCNGQITTPYEIIYQREGEDFSLSDKICDYLTKLSDRDILPRDILLKDDLEIDKKEEWFKKYDSDILQCFNDVIDVSGSYIIDSYYICSAMQKIVSFVSKGKDQHEIVELLDCVKRNVYFLWYEIPNNDNMSSEEIFLKINSGSIRLTNAELIKSLVLKNDSVNLLDNCRQWENIERGLSKDELWSFVSGTYSSDTRIDFLLYINANRKGYKLKSSQPNNEYALFDWYNEYNKTDPNGFSKDVLDGLNNIYDRICEWYDDVQIYHYIGLLSVMLKLGFKYDDKLYCTPQDMIKELYLKSNLVSGKDEFVFNLKKYVSECLKSDLKKNTPSRLEQLVIGSDSYNNDFFNYEDDSKRIEAVLWTLNAWETINSTDNRIQKNDKTYSFKDVMCRRLPFSEALSGAWSLEHIFPQHPDKKNSKALEKYISDISGLKKENRLPEDETQSIKNLALLKTKTNSALQNEMLRKKRIKLIEKIGNGEFVPPSTINAFMLYYNNIKADSDNNTSNTEQDINYWTVNDAEKYEKRILECINSIDRED